MSTALELPHIGKTKENDKEEEEKVEEGEGATAIGGESEKASRVVGSEGDDKEEEEKLISCSICCSKLPKAHKSNCCPWRVRVPFKYVPKVSQDWMVVCKSCGKERFHYENVACSCGYHVMYVSEKSCVACLITGHRNDKDTACKYYGKTREDDPFYKRVKRMLEKLALDPECP